MKNKKKIKKINSGQVLWKHAKKIIPGGNMFFSKKPDLFLPNIWPTYYSKAKGCNIWDLDNVKYTDVCLMGVGTNTLGYSNKDIDNAVIKNIRRSNTSTFNNPEEVELAEKLINIHPWSEMVKFARTGGEASLIALRAARAATGKSKIAFCGYHGWHDWYLSANLKKNNNLEPHLLSGINTLGVPKFYKNQVMPFNYNNIKELEEIFKKNEISAVIMEVSRNIIPNNNFLKKVKKLAKKNNSILIFDECTSGFRENYGGLHLKYNVNPDIALFGKAIGNGYAITAVLGKKSVMENIQKSFVSSTFWSERIGPTAALATLNVMKKTESWKKLCYNGKLVKEGWKNLSKEFSLDINILGRPCLLNMSFNSKHNLAYKTYITQELLKKGLLASNALYLSIYHDEKIINRYLNELRKVFKEIVKFEDGLNVYDYLDGPIAHSSFKRLN